jgi:hypothetical protein
MIQAFIYYVANIYPQGVNICRLLDRLSQGIILGESSSCYWPDEDILKSLDIYCQTEEKDLGRVLKNGWDSIDFLSTDYSAQLAIIFSRDS